MTSPHSHDHDPPPDPYTPMGTVERYGSFARGLRGALHDRSRPAVRATAWVLVGLFALVVVATVIGMATGSGGR